MVGLLVYVYTERVWQEQAAHRQLNYNLNPQPVSL